MDRSTVAAAQCLIVLLLGAAPMAQPRAADPQLEALLKEAAERNPDVQAARREVHAARQRVEPAAALDDPMLEAGLVNVPVPSWSLNREDMTMKMIGVTQRLPYPGKRALRRGMAEKEAEAADNSVRELVNKVRRDVKAAYYDLALVDESERLTRKNLQVLEQFSSIAESRYGVGQASQADVLKAQTQRARMQEELIKLGRERPMLEAELARALGRAGSGPAVSPAPLRLQEASLDLAQLQAAARANRPQLLAQQSMIERNGKALDMARKDYYPDFDLRFSYGQRDNLEMMKREDMISFTVAINLPIWRGSKRAPRVAEAEAMREQASSLYQAKANETDAMLRQQVSAAEQSLKSARLYETALLPQAKLATDASLTAYRVGRVDFFTLLDSQMTVFNAETGYAASLASRSKALAEIELLTGRELFQ
jgi:cobalt-zinc-cadmium efflux system outer membrane protein